MKQFFSPLTEPLGAVWLLMALGVLWLLVRRQWRSAIWLGIPTVLIFLVGSTSIAECLVAAEERQWAEDGGREGKAEMLKAESGNVLDRVVGERPHGLTRRGVDAPAADAVVALGGGDRISQHDALGFAICDGGSRLLTAIEIVRSGQAKTLVLGGSWPLPSNTKLPSMSVVQAWVASWGLVSSGVTNLGICINTHDEALAFKQLKESQGWKSVLLVTSALHMRRSEALFRKQGIEVMPVAADFVVFGVPQEMPFTPFPRLQRLNLLALYLHEKIGWWVYRLRGWV
jgi:uncharacterized SAM-binding protein YcdF (DUF218 family)